MSIFIAGSQLNPNANYGANPTIPVPAGAAAGDIFIGGFVRQIAGGSGAQPTVPAGWTEISPGFLAQYANRGIKFAYLVASGGESGNFTFGVSSGDWSNAGVALYRAGTLYTSLARSQNQTTFTTPTITVASAGDNVILINANADGQVVTTPPAGFISDYQAPAPGGNDEVNFVSGQAAAPGSQNWTLGLGGTLFGQWTTAALALTPPAAPPDPTLGMIQPIVHGRFA